MFLGVDQQAYRKRDKVVPPLVPQETKERLASDANANGACRVSSLIHVHMMDEVGCNRVFGSKPQKWQAIVT